MYNIRRITEDLYWVGANDNRISLFENIHPVQKGVSYNSYLLIDEKTVLFDAIDWSAGRQLIDNVKEVLGGRTLDYLVISHVEPDHSASVEEIVLRYPDVKVIASETAFRFMDQFGFNYGENKEVVSEGDVKSFGKHELSFIAAPMVHWPEVMMSYDKTNGVLFSADGFGTFGALNGRIFADEYDFEREILGEARRYYANIVGKFGANVQLVLNKIANLDIKFVCPLHGPIWRENIDTLVDKYQKWSTYEAEEKGVLILYASMYGNMETAAQLLATQLADKGVSKVAAYDVSKTDVSEMISEIFKYSHVVFASVTYNLGIYPLMHNVIADMNALKLQNRTVAIMEAGSWAIRSGALMKEELEKMKNMRIMDEKVTILSSLNEDSKAQLDALTDALVKEVK
jgi:flavorubredoxin